MEYEEELKDKSKIGNQTRKTYEVVIHVIVAQEMRFDCYEGELLLTNAAFINWRSHSVRINIFCDASKPNEVPG